MARWFRRMERQWMLLPPTGFLLTDVMISKCGKRLAAFNQIFEESGGHFA